MTRRDNLPPLNTARILRSRIDPNTACRSQQDDNAQKQEEKQREHSNLRSSLCSHRRALLGKLISCLDDAQGLCHNKQQDSYLGGNEFL